MVYLCTSWFTKTGPLRTTAITARAHSRQPCSKASREHQVLRAHLLVLWKKKMETKQTGNDLRSYMVIWGTRTKLTLPIPEHHCSNNCPPLAVGWNPLLTSKARYVAAACPYRKPFISLQQNAALIPVLCFQSTCLSPLLLRMELSDWLHQYSHTVCGKFFNRPNSFWGSRQLLQPIAGDFCIQSNTKATFLGANSRLTGLFLLALHGHPMPGTHFMQNHPKRWLILSFFFLYKILHPTQNVNTGILTLKVVPTESGGLTDDSGWVNSYLVFVHGRLPLSQASASPLHSGDGVWSILAAHRFVVST